MDLLSKLRRGLGLSLSAPPLVWLDASMLGAADLGGAIADLVVRPAWHEREAVCRLLLENPVRLIIEYESRDRALGALAREAWGEVRWDGPTVSSRPLSLTDFDAFPEASVQLAKALGIRQTERPL